MVSEVIRYLKSALPREENCFHLLFLGSYTIYSSMAEEKRESKVWGGNSNTLPRTKGHAARDPGRPLSVYDNHRVSPVGSERIGNTRDAWNQAQQLLATTVPQKIVPSCSLSGRHTPTRNSLRHSRMIVLSRTGKVPRKYLPPVLRHHKTATVLVTWQLLLGLAVLSLGMWLLFWAPNLRVRDNPYWSGGPLLLTGMFGVFLVCCCRKDYPGMPLGCCIFSVKMSCEPTLAATGSSRNNTCVCTNSPAIASDIQGLYQMHTMGRVYNYKDLTCDDVE
ncbi:hypothetical protein J437_LFUL017970, partial [Ladona fulva]